MMTSRIRRLMLTAAAAGLACSFAAPLQAAGSDSGEPPATTQTTTECKDGMVYDKKTKTCVKPDKSSMNDTELYEAARELAYAGQYENAIGVLRAAKNQDDPRILNYMGFANRKAGRIDLAMTYYRKALAIDANYLLARSYMGQGLIAQGKIEEARAQLIEIRDRGGKGTYAYQALYEALKHGSTY